MKCLVWIMVMFYSFFATQVAQAQELHGFNIDNGKLIWQMVFSSDKSMDEMTTEFRQSKAIQQLESSGYILTGKLINLDVDYKGAGFSWTATPDYVLFNDVSTFFSVEFEEGRYRVTVDQVYLKEKNTDPQTGIRVTLLSTHVLKKGRYKSSFKKSGAELYNYTFSQLFEPRVENKEW